MEEIGAIAPSSVTTPIPSGWDSVAWFPGNQSINTAHQTIGQQPDNLCGPYWLAVLLQAVGVEGIDSSQVAQTAGTVLPTGDPRDSVPPGASNRLDYSVPLPKTNQEAEGGTSVFGLLQAFAEIAGTTHCLIPVRCQTAGIVIPWSATTVKTLLQTCFDHPQWKAGLVANGRTGKFWGSHLSEEAAIAYLEGTAIQPPPSDWDVGHFVTLAGWMVGSARSLIVVRDTYPILGRQGYHLQSLEAIANFLNRDDGSEGGILLFASKSMQAEIEATLQEVGFAIAPWKNGTPWQSQE